MVDINGKTDVERAAERAMRTIDDLAAAPDSVIEALGGEAVTEKVDAAKPLTVEEGFDVLCEWKSSLTVYGNTEYLVRATAFYGSSEPNDERKFWREMRESVRRAEALKADLEAFLAASARFPRVRLY